MITRMWSLLFLDAVKSSEVCNIFVEAPCIVLCRRVLKPGHQSRYLHSAVLLGRLMLVFGGNTHNDTSAGRTTKCYSSNFMVYDLGTLTVGDLGGQWVSLIIIKNVNMLICQLISHRIMARVSTTTPFNSFFSAVLVRRVELYLWMKSYYRNNNVIIYAIVL